MPVNGLRHMGFLVLAAPVCHAQPVEFLVSELPDRVVHGDSFTITLEDPTLIEHARDLVEFGPLIPEMIVVARVASGGDGINRDVLAPGEAPWNWRILEVLSFDELSAELFDAWPTFVGEDPDGWMANTSPVEDGVGIIGFWTYTVTQELGAPPSPCLADLAPPEGALDFNDVIEFLAAFGRSAPAADQAPPFGVWDFSDVIAYLNAFSAGCP